MNDLDDGRFSLPMGTDIKLEFSAPTSVQETDTLEWLKGLSPKKRTVLLTELWYNAHQRELARVGGW